MAEVHVQKGEFLLENWRTHCETGNHVTFLVSDDDLEPFKLATIHKGKQVGQRYSFFLVQIGPDEQPVPPPPPVPPKPPKPETAEQKAVREAAEFHAKTPDLLATAGPIAQPAVLHNPSGATAFEVQPDGSYARTLEPKEAKAVLDEAQKAANDAEFGQPHKGHGFPEGLTGLAVRWCLDEHFQEWVTDHFPDMLVEDTSTLEAIAKGVICKVCQIASRTELDSNQDAGSRFRELILLPYQERRANDGVDDDPPPEQDAADKPPF